MNQVTLPTVRINKTVCVGCGICLPCCPNGAISLQSGACTIDEKKCTGCGRCLEACPRRAITRYAGVNYGSLADTVASLKSRANEMLERIEELRRKSSG